MVLKFEKLDEFLINMIFEYGSFMKVWKIGQSIYIIYFPPGTTRF
jgi:hypothetical protein